MASATFIVNFIGETVSYTTKTFIQPHLPTI
jgi:hypothetical protein